MELSFFTSENERRKSRCCFTGHRPEKLDCSEQEAIALLQKNIRYAYDLGYTTFITGMSRGVDIWAAEIVLEENSKEHLAGRVVGKDQRGSPVYHQG